MLDCEEVLYITSAIVTGSFVVHTEQCGGVPMHSEQFQTSVFLDYWHTLEGQNYFAGKSCRNWLHEFDL